MWREEPSLGEGRQVHEQVAVRRGPVEIRLELAAHPQSAPAARHAVRRLLAGSPLAARSDDAELAVSELVSNAVLHGRKPLEVVLSLDATRLRVEVHDGSSTGPAFSMLDAAAVTGRGLVLVASCTDRWGVEPTPRGKAVWFEVGPQPAQEQEVDVDALLAAWADDLVDPADEVVKVVLTNLDVHLVARSEAHVEGLLRELALLVASGTADAAARQVAGRVLRAAAAVEQLRAEVRRQVTAALSSGQAVVDVVLEVTRVDAETVRGFSSAADDADRLSRAGSLLTQPAPHELSDARRAWLLRTVRQLDS